MVGSTTINGATNERNVQNSKPAKIVHTHQPEVKFIDEPPWPWWSTNKQTPLCHNFILIFCNCSEKPRKLETFVCPDGHPGRKKCSFSISFLFPSCWHTWYLSRAPREYPCKFFLASVKFYRFNAKNWQFTVYFAVITKKIGNLLCILS